MLASSLIRPPVAVLDEVFRGRPIKFERFAGKSLFDRFGHVQGPMPQIAFVGDSLHGPGEFTFLQVDIQQQAVRLCPRERMA